MCAVCDLLLSHCSIASCQEAELEKDKHGGQSAVTAGLGKAGCCAVEEVNSVDLLFDSV